MTAERMSRDERRKQIIHVTFDLCHKESGRITTRDIATAAGIAEGTIFRIFSSLDDLFIQTALLTLSEERIQEIVERESFPGTLEADVRRALEIVAEFMKNVQTVLHIVHAVGGGKKSGAKYGEGYEKSQAKEGGVVEKNDEQDPQMPIRTALFQRYRQLHALITASMQQYAKDLVVAPEQLATLVLAIASTLNDRMPIATTSDIDSDVLVRVILNGTRKHPHSY